MLPGLGGHLVSEFFLESRLAAIAPAGRAAAEAARRTLLVWRKRCRSLGPSSSIRAVLEVGAAPLLDVLGFEAARIEQADPMLTVARVRREGDDVVVLVAPWGARLDPLWRLAVTHALRRQAHWSLIFNGTHLRVVDAGRLYARRHLEFDLDLALDDERTFAALWWLLHASPFAAALRSIVDESDRQASGVCRSLRDGVLAASRDILGALIARESRVPLAECFEQALTIVYRLLFLLFAEARCLVPLWHPVYRESYSVEALRLSAERPEKAVGLWETVRAMTRLAHAGCRAGDLRVTPFNGRLFAPSRTPLADRRNLDNGAARRAVLALSTRAAPDGAGRERIAYRDLGVEQLGAVYETLLDYTPRVDRPLAARAPAPARVALERGADIRKATGTFYTPQPIAEYLIRRTLGPLVRGAPPDRILALRVVDPAMGSGAFLVAACRYLAAAYEAALVRTSGWHASDFDDGERASIRRTIAERCLYGVDLNPMAVQLARLSLWLATLAADRPLTFLDHHLQVGDSLLGAWIRTLSDAPLAGKRRRPRDERTLPLFGEIDVRHALEDALPLRVSLECGPGDTLEQVRAKERTLATLARRDTGLAKWKQVADLWCASWFSTQAQQVPAAAFRDVADAILTGRSALPAASAGGYTKAATDISRTRRLFHWELEFPEVFFDADGSRRPAPGFDAVIGNPPWDMLRADAGPADRRPDARTDLAHVLRFTRDSGIYSAQSDGHANRYQLFLERALSLTRTGGRIGLVLPSGLAVDHGSSRLRGHLLQHCDVDALVGFDNQQGVFPIHRSVRFLLLTGTAGSPTRTIACRLGVRDPATLESIGDEPAERSPSFPVHLSPAVLRRLSGEDLAIPDLRVPIDLAIAERAAALFPPLGSERGWHARFGRELNATDDRGAFHSGGGAGLPVVEGKQLEPFHVRLASVRFRIAEREARRILGGARLDAARLAYRDVASATNRQTLIAAILPAGCVSTHTVFCLRTPLPISAQHFLCGVFNSFVVNYLVRLRVTTHVTTATVERLPIPGQDDGPGAFRQIAALARLLARRPEGAASAQLQAVVATLYQLTPEEFAHILGTFPLVPPQERDAALTALTETRRPPR